MASVASATARMWGVWLRRLPLLAPLLAVAAMVLLALGPLGWRFGWWHFRFAFFWLMPWAGYCGAAALALAILAAVFGARSMPRWRMAIVALGFVIGAAIAYVPWHYNQLRGSVPNDISTDLQNPPVYVAVLAQRKADNSQNNGEYKTEKGEQQRKNYPDIAPVTLDLPPAQAFDRALAAAKQLGWTIVQADKEAGQIEASEKSRWYGFTDDVVIRIAAAGNGSRIDIRSSSRLGTGDFGVNAARTRKFLAALRDISQKG